MGTRLKVISTWVLGISCIAGQPTLKAKKIFFAVEATVAPPLVQSSTHQWAPQPLPPNAGSG